MTDPTAIAIPTAAILFGILWNQRAVDQLEKRMNLRFEQVEKLISNVDGRVDGLSGRLEGLSVRIDNLSTRIDRIQSEVNGRLDRMQSDLLRFYQTLGEHSAKIDMLMERKP